MFCKNNRKSERLFVNKRALLIALEHMSAQNQNTNVAFAFYLKKKLRTLPSRTHLFLGEALFLVTICFSVTPVVDNMRSVYTKAQTRGRSCAHPP